jgi:hypothetical protein
VTGKQWAAVVGGILLIIGGEIVNIVAWPDMLTPGFIGRCMVQTAGLITAIWGAYRASPASNGNGRNSL